MSKPERIGIFGGTFDPIHRTHITIARHVQREARLDRVLFVVAAEPPHKQGAFEATATQRYAMVEAALANTDGLEPCDLELKRDGLSYTADTLATIHEQYPDAQLFLIMGLDTMVDLPGWHQPQRILEFAHILAVARPGTELTIPESLEGHATLIPFTGSTLSSTEIRNRIESGDRVDELIDPAVRTIIREHGLYGA